MLRLLPPRYETPLSLRYDCRVLTGEQGHAGAIVQARLLGDELYVGVHSDEAIMENKGPTVMTLQERYPPRIGDRLRDADGQGSLPSTPAGG